MIDFNSPSGTGELAYDLRQIYAKIVGEHLVDIAESRKANNFYTWYKALEDLHTIIKHKFKKADDEKKYNEVRNKITELANKYPSAWLNQSKDNKERGEIEESLRHLEEFLYEKMNDAKMFGESGRIPGL